MRILLCAVMVLCSLLIGIEFAKKYKLCCDLINDMCGLCLHMQSCIRYERTEPELIMQSFLSKSAPLNTCRESISCGLTFHEAWLQMINSNGIAMLDENEMQLIREMGEGLGMYDSEGELARLSRVHSQLESCLRKRLSEFDSKRRLCVTYGALAGVFVSILII